MGPSDPRTVGGEAEQIALDYLRARKLRLIARNFCCRVGEIDLVMEDGHCLVFVEVRYRKPNRFASAALSVNLRKQRKLIKAASFFLCRNAHLADRVMRFDVVALDGPSESKSTLQWLQDAFRP
ncbi:MAG: YraN family protein [Gammaproteobacteria bacterium]|nr:YraN family protein [Gammaproteobacteria bacterium]